MTSWFAVDAECSLERTPLYSTSIFTLPHVFGLSKCHPFVSPARSTGNRSSRRSVSSRRTCLLSVQCHHESHCCHMNTKETVFSPFISFFYSPTSHIALSLWNALNSLSHWMGIHTKWKIFHSHLFMNNVFVYVISCITAWQKNAIN